VRILIFHAYLLRGTGSNIYNASLARALARMGHEVHLLCQDRHARDLDFVDAVGTWDRGELNVEGDGGEATVTAYVPDIGRTLPVYVADAYEGFDAVRLPDMDDDSIERYLDANVRAVRDVAERSRPDVALANHLVMGPVIVARALGGRVPYAVKVHGSALEYVVRQHPERFLPYAREGLDQANAVLVGSRHTGESLWEVMDDPGLPDRTRLGPPGVDAEDFVPRPPADARERAVALADRIADSSGGWGGEAGAAAAISRSPIEGVELRGIESALPPPEALEAIAAADAIVVGPSNPIISIGPILAVPGMREALRASAAPVVAVSPFVAGRAVKGPTDAFMNHAGYERSAAGIARAYAGLLDGIVSDEDSGEPLPVPSLIADTLMHDAAARRRVANEVLGFASSFGAPEFGKPA
jgi:glycosyltransferase involved in cell wall biosynthesis